MESKQDESKHGSITVLTPMSASIVKDSVRQQDSGKIPVDVPRTYQDIMKEVKNLADKESKLSLSPDNNKNIATRGLSPRSKTLSRSMSDEVREYLSSDRDEKFSYTGHLGPYITPPEIPLQPKRKRRISTTKKTSMSSVEVDKDIAVTVKFYGQNLTDILEVVKRMSTRTKRVKNCYSLKLLIVCFHKHHFKQLRKRWFLENNIPEHYKLINQMASSNSSHATSSSRQMASELASSINSLLQANNYRPFRFDKLFMRVIESLDNQ